MPTYVVRLLGDPGDPLRGWVRHVASGEQIPFAGSRTLIEFLEGTQTSAEWVAARPPDTDDAPPDRSRRER